jgi:hypothetical protein
MVVVLDFVPIVEEGFRVEGGVGLVAVQLLVDLLMYS